LHSAAFIPLLHQLWTDTIVPFPRRQPQQPDYLGLMFVELRKLCGDRGINWGILTVHGLDRADRHSAKELRSAPSRS
jgi:hypothetical protein